MYETAALLLLFVAATPSAEKAAALIESAVELYREGAYREAGEKFLEAHALIDRPVQLRNAAKAFEEAGDERALELWTRYRDLPGLSTDDRAEAKAHLDLIQAKQREASARAEADAARIEAERARAAQARAEEEARAHRGKLEEADLLLQARVEERAAEGGAPIAGYVLCGAGGSFAISSLIVFLVAKKDEGELDRQLATRTNGLITGTTLQGKNDAVSKIRTERTISALLLGAGTAALGAGLAVLLLPTSESIAVAPASDGGGATVLFHGSF